ncbi:hypothetical protein [Streptomyces sp. NPDC008001]|uniref:hypothetical protein n=1 Tax=Streptomyces sp. NPDC008001 TaxID=3364804 RepID=UPI0036E49D2E
MTEARTGEQGRRGDLMSGLASPSAHTGLSWMHVAEGVLLAVTAASAGKYFADDRGLPWLTPVGAVAAVLILVATIAIVRGEAREARRMRSRAAEVAALTAEARYCQTCRGVFHPSGIAWSGLATPEQFRRHIWTAAGYGDLLDPGGRT